MSIAYLALLHAEDAHHAAWEAFLSGIPMTWINRGQQ